MNSPTRRLAFARELAWLQKHGRHDYIGRDLRREAWEELADAYNYLRESGDEDLADKALLLGDELARRAG